MKTTLYVRFISLHVPIVLNLPGGLEIADKAIAYWLKNRSAG